MKTQINYKNFFQNTIGILILLCLWQISSFFVAKKIYPSPIAIITSFPKYYFNLFHHLIYSVFRLFAGILLAIFLGFPLGLLMGYYKILNNFFSPILYILAPIPKISLLPLIMLFLGIGNISKIFIIFIIIVFQIIVSVRDSVLSLPENYFVCLKTVKANDSFIIKHVLFPAALPNLFTALRISLATGISVLFFSETFGTKWGMGFYIIDMWMRLDYTQMYAGIIFLGFLGLICALLVDFAEKKFCGWNQFEM